MLHRIGKILLCFCVLGIFALSSACSHKKKSSDSAFTDSSSATIGESDLGSSDTGQAQGLQTVRFAYDSNLLSEEAKSILKANSEILKDKSAIHVQVEGHCDSRGGIQYNLALGERRAHAVKSYLQDLGVLGSRITTISYGKERPIDLGQTEEAFAKNRRANFVITAQ